MSEIKNSFIKYEDIETQINNEYYGGLRLYFLWIPLFMYVVITSLLWIGATEGKTLIDVLNYQWSWVPVFINHLSHLKVY